MIRPVILAAVAAVFITTAVLGQPPKDDAQGGPRLVVVGPVVRVHDEQPPQTKTFIGTVVPERTSIVGSAVDGRVEEMFVEEGDFVARPRPGEPMARLAKLRTTTIEIELAAARADEALRRHELEELQEGYLPEEIEQAQAKMRGAEATWKFTQERLKRTNELYRQNRSATAEQLEEAVQEEAAAQQAYIAAKAQLKLVEDGPRVEKVKQAEARLAQAEQIALRLEDMKQKYTIRAPFEGFVVAKHTEVGAWISQGDPVVEVVKLDVVDVDVAVPESDVRNLREGDIVQVTFQSLGQERHPGEIRRIIPQADPRSRTFPVKVRLDANPDYPQSPQIKAGMLAQVELPISSQAGLFVPKDALTLNRGGKCLFVVRKDDAGIPRAKMIPVTSGESQGKLIQVTDATDELREGDLVVTRGNERLRPGEAVKIREGEDS
jgi:RND family efflux transporter MFP subunit